MLYGFHWRCWMRCLQGSWKLLELTPLTDALLVSGVWCSDGLGVAELFASHFKSVHVPPSAVDLSYSNMDSFLFKEIVDVIFLQFSIVDIYNKLDNIDISKSPGPDGIPPSFLKNCALSLSRTLWLIFTKSLSTEPWKIIFASPILKIQVKYRRCRKLSKYYTGVSNTQSIWITSYRFLNI